MNLCTVVLSLFIAARANSKPLSSASPAAEQSNAFCRNDYLIIQGRNNFVLSVRRAATGEPVRLTEKNVTRHELVRLEAYNMKNQQWVIRTWNGRHLAVDSKGRLTVKTGCVTTTFLRVVLPEYLQQCFNGERCPVLLCATSKTTGHSFMVSPENNGTYRLRDGQCKTYSTFNGQTTLEQLKRKGFDNAQSSFTFVHSVSEDGLRLLGSDLKLACPTIFDPKGEMSQDFSLCTRTN